MVLKLVFFQYGSNVFLRGKLILAKGNDCAVIINDAPLQLLALPLGAPEVSPLSERAQEEQMPPKAEREMPKERAERMDQRQRIARSLRSVTHDHFCNVPFGVPAKSARHSASRGSSAVRSGSSHADPSR